MQVYTEAGIREGLDVRGAFIHDLKDGTRVAVDTAEGARARAVETVLEAVAGIRERKFDAKPHVMKCGRCDVRAICRVAAKN